MANVKNLRPIPLNKRSKEERFKIQSMGGKAAAVANKKRKLFKEIYAEFLVKNHKVKLGKKEVEMTADEIINAAVMKTLNTGSSATVAMLKEMADRTEGTVGSSDAAKKDLDVLGGLMGTAANEEKTEVEE